MFDSTWLYLSTGIQLELSFKKHFILLYCISCRSLSLWLVLIILKLTSVVIILKFFTLDRFFGLVQHTVPPKLKRFWCIVWTFISPPVMFIIFWGSVANELVRPLSYSQFSYAAGEEVS